MPEGCAWSDAALDVGGDDDEAGSFLSRGLEVSGDECPEDAREEACDNVPWAIRTDFSFGGKSCDCSTGVEDAWDG